MVYTTCQRMISDNIQDGDLVMIENLPFLTKTKAIIKYISLDRKSVQFQTIGQSDVNYVGTIMDFKNYKIEKYNDDNVNTPNHYLTEND